MGENNLHSVGDGDVYSDDDINQFTTALKGDHVPRNNAGTPTERAGDLGTTTLPWRNLHIDRIFLGGDELIGGGGESIINGVIDGLEIAGWPGSCGWMFQAGAQGIRLEASQDDPLQVVVGGVTYLLEDTRIDGAALPADLNTASFRFERDSAFDIEHNSDELVPHSLYDDPRTIWYIPASRPIFDDLFADFRIPNQSTDIEFIGGRVSFGTADDNIAAADGDVFALKFASGGVTEYVLGQRAIQEIIEDVSHPRGVTRKRTDRMTVKLLHRCGLNYNTSLSGNGFTTNKILLQPDSQFTAVRCGHVFVDPTTARWSIAVEKRTMVVYGLENMPDLASVAAGTMVFTESEKYWYRSDGTSWVKTNRVYLGVCVVEGGRVRAVVGVKTLATMRAMKELYLNILPDEFAFRYCMEVDDVVSFSRDNPATRRPSPLTWAAAIAQETNIPNKDTINVNLNIDGIKVNNSRMFAYVEIGEQGNVFYDAFAPTPVWFNGEAMYTHPHRSAIFIGGFFVDNNGDIQTVIETGQRTWLQIPWFAFSMWEQTGGDISTPNDNRERYRKRDGTNEVVNAVIVGNHFRAFLTVIPDQFQAHVDKVFIMPLHKAAVQSFFEDL